MNLEDLSKGDFVRVLYDQVEQKQVDKRRRAYGYVDEITIPRGSILEVAQINNVDVHLARADGTRVYGVAFDSIEKLTPLELLAMEAE